MWIESMDFFSNWTVALVIHQNIDAMLLRTVEKYLLLDLRFTRAQGHSQGTFCVCHHSRWLWMTVTAQQRKVTLKTWNSDTTEKDYENHTTTTHSWAPTQSRNAWNYERNISKNVFYNLNSSTLRFVSNVKCVTNKIYYYYYHNHLLL